MNDDDMVMIKPKCNIYQIEFTSDSKLGKLFI